MPVFVGLVVVFVALIAWLFNAAADPHEQWLSTPHVFLYLGGMVAAVVLYFQALRPATRLQQSFRDTLLPMIFGFVRDVRYQHGARPSSFERMPRETVAAWAERHRGEPLKRGEALAVGDYRITALDVTADRVRRMRIERLPTESKE